MLIHYDDGVFDVVTNNFSNNSITIPRKGESIKRLDEKEFIVTNVMYKWVNNSLTIDVYTKKLELMM